MSNNRRTSRRQKRMLATAHASRDNKLLARVSSQPKWLGESSDISNIKSTAPSGGNDKENADANKTESSCLSLRTTSSDSSIFDALDDRSRKELSSKNAKAAAIVAASSAKLKYPSVYENNAYMSIETNVVLITYALRTLFFISTFFLTGMIFTGFFCFYALVFLAVAISRLANGASLLSKPSK